MSEQLENDEWYSGFDVVGFETMPISELPEDDGFHLICPIEDCAHEEEFEHLGDVRDSSWSQMSQKDEMLTDGTTLKQAYCPSHSLDEEEDVPLDIREQPTHERDRDRYAMYDFLGDGEEVQFNGNLLTCGCQSCYREAEFESLEEAEEDGWASGMMVFPCRMGECSTAVDVPNTEVTSNADSTEN